MGLAHLPCRGNRNYYLMPYLLSMNQRKKNMKGLLGGYLGLVFGLGYSTAKFMVSILTGLKYEYTEKHRGLILLIGTVIFSLMLSIVMCPFLGIFGCLGAAFVLMLLLGMLTGISELIRQAIEKTP